MKKIPNAVALLAAAALLFAAGGAEAATISLDASLTADGLELPCTLATATGLGSLTQSVSCSGWTGTLPYSAAAVSVAGWTFTATAGNSTAMPGGVPIAASTRAALGQSLTITGGVGFGTLLVEYTLSCSGSNQALSTRPLVSVTAGAVNQSNSSTVPCSPVYGALSGSFTVPFEYGVTSIALLLDTLPVQSANTSFDIDGRRNVEARLSILTAANLESTATIDVPETGTWVAGAGIVTAAIAAHLRRRHS